MTNLEGPHGLEESEIFIFDELADVQFCEKGCQQRISWRNSAMCKRDRSTRTLRSFGKLVGDVAWDDARDDPRLGNTDFIIGQHGCNRK